MLLARISMLSLVILIIASIVTDSFKGYPYFLVSGVVIVLVFDIFYCWAWGFYHCLTHQFNKRYYKTISIVLMVCFHFIWAMVYHILVCELKLFVKETDEKNISMKDFYKMLYYKMASKIGM